MLPYIDFLVEVGLVHRMDGTLELIGLCRIADMLSGAGAACRS
jgi:hypothetical protein